MKASGGLPQHPVRLLYCFGLGFVPLMLSTCPCPVLFLGVERYVAQLKDHGLAAAAPGSTS